MTYCSTYIGDLDDPEFHLDRPMTLNIPRALSDSFPPVGEHYNAMFHRWINEKQIPCVQTDYNGWVASVTKAQLNDYIDFAYGSCPSYTDVDKMLTWEGEAYLVAKLNIIKHLVATLDESKQYGLVAECD